MIPLQDILNAALNMLQAANVLGIDVENNIKKHLAKEFYPFLEGEEGRVKVFDYHNNAAWVKHPNDHEIALARKNKIEGIKAYKERTKESLIICKRAIEAVM